LGDRGSFSCGVAGHCHRLHIRQFRRPLPMRSCAISSRSLGTGRRYPLPATWMYVTCGVRSVPRTTALPVMPSHPISPISIRRPPGCSAITDAMPVSGKQTSSIRLFARSKWSRTFRGVCTRCGDMRFKSARERARSRRLPLGLRTGGISACGASCSMSDDESDGRSRLPEENRVTVVMLVPREGGKSTALSLNGLRPFSLQTVLYLTPCRWEVLDKNMQVYETVQRLPR
jgi:hypothetical protein